MSVHRIRKSKFIVMTHLEWVQPPSVPVTGQSENGADVIAEDDLHEVTTVDKACSMEELVILLTALGLILGWGVGE